MTDADVLFDGRAFAAMLFDMDGTLLSSIEAAERVWGRWAAQFGIDAATFLPSIHGRRTIESVRSLNLPGIDPEEQAAEITRAELEDVEGIHVIPGAHDLIASLPEERWAIVTSASKALATRRLAAIGLRPPTVFITAEDIPKGKPDPACYQLAASQLGFKTEDCVVFEDAAAGIEAGERAGAAVVVITATHQHAVHTPHPRLKDYRNLRTIAAADGNLKLALAR
jgi:mannitol-1-/sugar-/sorbitol-6-phosphatase